MHPEQASGTLDRLMFYCLCGVFFLVPVATSPAVIASALLVALWLFSGRFYREKGQWFRQEWALPVLAVVALHFIGLLYTDDLDTGLHYARKSHYWLNTLAVSCMLMGSTRIRLIIKSYIAGVSFTSALFILQSLKLVPMIPPYSVGLQNKWAHISFSLLLAFGILMISYFIRAASTPRERHYGYGLLVLNIISLSILLSDSGHLAYILLSPVVAYNIIGRRSYPGIAALSLLLIAALFLSPVTRGRLNDAISGTVAYSENKTLTPVSGRYYMWTGAMKIYLNNPVIGVGTGGYQLEMERYREADMLPVKNASEDPVQPHNSFLYMLVSFGIPGLAAITWFFFMLLRKGWRGRNTLAGYSVLGFTLVLLIGSLTDTQIMQVHTATLMSLFTGLRVETDESTAA